MTKLFGNLTDTDALETSEDRLGGGFEPLMADAYVGTIKLAYVGKAAASNAQSVTLHVDINGKEFRETIWITNREGQNFYTDKQDATKKHPLPGFTTVDDICLLAVGESLIEQETEEKVVKLYNFAERKEVPTPVQTLSNLHGKPICLGLILEIVDKEKKDLSGKYQPTGETRSQNKIDKVFHPETGRTVNEYRNEVTTPEFRDAWVKKNRGKERNNAKGAGAANSGSAGTGSPLGAATPKKSLFGAK